ncbi:hypothetical protein HPP92_009279 [Vanilla planifolia]|uniref:TCP domain-containing protein n=1 Tax=Vanilla planifolia TaxID=51239 RepID=A0A835RE05_VANPL|nr:hypothetical protein HPP92_009279 [Vanilla planifolia]
MMKEQVEKAEAEHRKTRSLWSTLKNPRIVSVSGTLGGKDRHSKVRTMRGLRDRRVRLSVPTAIQLYELQHRLGLEQPSKVVDWLMDAARHEIDKLPALHLHYAQEGITAEQVLCCSSDAGNHAPESSNVAQGFLMGSASPSMLPLVGKSSWLPGTNTFAQFLTVNSSRNSLHSG